MLSLSIIKQFRGDVVEKTRWYKDAIVYQIYPRSFCDSNGDGIGDIQGVISKLDYIKSIGVTAIWISPYFKSPNDDNGYDISDYRNIMDDFGTLDDFNQLISEMHKRGLKLIMDLVVNHTSDEHEWFEQSKSSKDNPYRDYYIWRRGKGKNGLKPPNNWTSRFGGSAWCYDESSAEWYLHLFTKKQPDLNWDNPKVRKEVADICNYWCDLGVDGFRCDVIDYVSKKEGLPNGKYNPIQRGDECFSVANKYHEYIHELYENSWSKYDIMTVGEGAGITVANAEKMVSEERQELDTIFTFEHQRADAFLSVIPRKFSLKRYKKVMSSWQRLPNGCQNSLFIENHDYPRALPRYVKLSSREVGAKMLAVSTYFLKGTPYIYQGQEIGMTNLDRYEPEDYRDVASVNMYNTAKAMFSPLSHVVKWALRKRGRDHARTPMQWNSNANAGFTTGTPWITVNSNYKTINVADNEKKIESVLGFYRKVITFVRNNEIIRDGNYFEYNEKSNKLYSYERELGDRLYLVICNWKDKNVNYKTSKKYIGKKVQQVINNYTEDIITKTLSKRIKLRPYEAVVYEIDISVKVEAKPTLNV